jgi:uncharacterized protein YfaS (alpha-2-macroglobulin family)
MNCKKILVILILILNITTLKAQNIDYAALWKKIDKAEEKGLTKDANTIAIQIFDAAAKSNNDVQQIKAAMHLMKYKNVVEEDNQQKNIFYVDTLIAKAKAPAKNILQSMQAQLFYTFKQYNRYKLYNRTKLEKEDSKDIYTWSMDKLNNTIGNLYKASLKNDELLKTTLLTSIEPIIEKGNADNLRPTIYDLLANRAIDFFSNDENDITKPAYKFIINDEAAFAPASEFVTHNFKTKDTVSNYYNAIKVMQSLLVFRLADTKNIDAFLDADMKRLAFMQAHGIFTNKEKLYENALLQIETKYSNNPASAQAAYLRAEMLIQHGNTYNPISNKETQFDLVKAKQILEAAAAKFPASEGGINCANALITLKTPSLSYAVEKVNVINDPFRALISYKNVDKIFCRLIKTNREEIKKMYGDDNGSIEMWKKFAALKPTKSWAVNLPNQNDLQTHHTEIKIDAVEQGSYFLLINLKEDFSYSKNIICRNVVYVSNVSYVQNNANDMYVVDRITGKPLEKATMQTWISNYDYDQRKYIEKKGEFYTADKNGYIKIKPRKDNNYYSEYYQFKYNNDELYTDDTHYNYYNDYARNEDYDRRKMKLFTDRSIYRPGQTVFFKGILFETDTTGRENKVLVNKKTTITLYDNNSQKIKSATFTTNEYGSINGNFILPEGLLNGSFRIEDSITRVDEYFSVEEYKRPKFITEIKKPTGTYKVNDSIKVVGTAKAYAGNNVDGASVSYRVVREVNYPIWWGYYRRGGYGRQNSSVEITNGKTITDAKGEFKFNFKAIPDETVDKKDQPTFTYKVYADVTDINGETRSGTTEIAVSYQAIQLNIEGNENINLADLNIIKISTTNSNAVFEKAKVQVVWYKLDEPTKMFRTRYWQQPDVFTMTKSEYYTAFPYDMYASENEKNSWEQTTKAIDVSDSTKENGEWKISPTNLKAGWYKIIATTKDKYGEEVKAEKFIQILSENNITKTPITITKENKDYVPGETIKYTVQTSFDKIYLIQNIKTNNTIVKTYPVINATEKYNNNIVLTEKDRGGIGINYVFVKNNRYYEGNESFKIPWSNKDLQISYETFRDKLEPGSKEKWKIKITGNKADKVAAEALISMYDASLDQFKPHNWQSFQGYWPGNYYQQDWNSSVFAQIESADNNTVENKYKDAKYRSYAGILNNGWNDLNFGRVYRRDKANREAKTVMSAPSTMSEVVVVGNAEVRKAKSVNVALEGKAEGLQISDSNGDGPHHIKVPKPKDDTDGDGIPDAEDKDPNSKSSNPPEVKIRKNFNETAFFIPDLKTDANGNIEFSFTMPEALTQWKMQVLGHTKDMASAVSSKTTLTQKQLMVQPNAPRFFREGDRMEFSAKVVNLTDKEVTGTTQLELIDAATNKPLDGWFKNVFPNQYFTVPAGQSVAVKFPMEIPFNFNSTLLYRIKAIEKTGSFSDGEEAALPVLTNRMLVTESLPLNLRNVASKNFKFEKLINSGSSSSLSNHALTVEYTSNPAWYVVQALPYLIEYPYECAEQTFSRYYANTLASYITSSSPKIKEVFEKWKITDTVALQSNLQKNEELKAVLLQETPWVLAAQNETQQKKNIAILFDMVRLGTEKDKTLATLKEMQSSNGGFVWFKGGKDDRYITQYILTGIGHLRKLNAVNTKDYEALKPIVEKALPYLDARLKDEYNDLIKYKAKLSDNNLSYTAIQYLYMRSFFAETNIAASSITAVDYYKGQAEKYWLSQTKYMQAMIALSLHRNNNTKTPKAIIESLKQNSISNEEFGMYWKEFNTSGYYWHQAPIESQALMIEAFTDIDKNEARINDLKTWLLKQKQTQNWGTTRATAEACYALLISSQQTQSPTTTKGQSPPTPQRGDLQTSVLNEENTVEIKLGNNTTISSNDGAEAGTGYFKKRIEGEKVNAQMGNITVEVKQNLPIGQPPPSGGRGASWGSAYWQYFEDLDKITSAETPLKLVKKLFIEKNTDRGPVLQAIKEGDEINVGDKIKVRIELRVDRAMEYVHMKDMRAACMEPTNVISEYKWQGGLGYYETTKDASTNFFFGWLPKGTYVFEYPMFVTHQGNFSNGITTIQCMYAPEFTSHSEGVRVSVK